MRDFDCRMAERANEGDDMAVLMCCLILPSNGQRMCSAGVNWRVLGFFGRLEEAVRKCAGTAELRIASHRFRHKSCRCGTCTNFWLSHEIILESFVTRVAENRTEDGRIPTSLTIDEAVA
jgi:hypothetical protein